MDGYKEYVRNILSRLRGVDVDREPVSSEAVTEILGNSGTVKIQRYPYSLVPPTTHPADGAEAADRWSYLEDTYELDRPVPHLETRYTDPRSYAIITGYLDDTGYKGRWRFQVEEEAVHTVLENE